ncbi:8-oxo-dGTP pyrophosphatase MutT (NUDIX family) [Microbacterium phyllosphaerae]|uniref:8-oxo-dGTP pyrophosphatase MutT (NUDIX family) n=1 Tax=Microbacterium phyllosphaerae TaxID=124798 RepID=A0ABS4WSF1_9MICO|nr:NUDIX hydrolase [Microbacterium phyllosphaerae]MBP2379144.1 8-oxo-dGTP pyrophosphatase MutT (NUDIX family) [Microbacterium phyllosphaerae]
MSSTPAPWRVDDSETVVADRWIRVRADDCRDADDRRIAPYYVLEYGDWISVLALNADGHAIVVEEYRHGAGIVAVGTIGGGMESGEAPIDAAARELREETGYEAGEIVELGSTWANFGNHTNRVHHFLARDCVRVAEQELDDSEAIAVHVVSLDGLGDHLAQSYHQLTWYKAMELLDR